MLEKIVSKKSKRRKRMIREMDENNKNANKEETSSIAAEKILTNQKTISRCVTFFVLKSCYIII